MIASASHVPLRLIRTFHDVAHLGSFTAVAAARDITQPAVSHQIRELEVVLGATLFRRRGRGVELTEAGETLASSVNPSVQLLDEGLARFMAQRTPNRVELRVNSTFATRWLIPRIGAFLQSHPEIELDLTSTYWSEGTRQGSAVHIDFGPPPVESEPIGGNEHLVVVASPTVAQRIDSTGELTGETLLEVRGGEGWAAYAKAAGLSLTSNRTHTSMTYLHTLALAEAGLGVALAHDFLIRDSIDAEALSPVDLPRSVAGEQYYLIAPPHDQTGPGTTTFLRWFRQAASLDKDRSLHRS